MPASVTQLDARPTGDQEVAGSIPDIFLWSFSLFRWFKKSSRQFLEKECAQYLLTA